MSVASVIDDILTSGIDLERVRIHKALWHHLQGAHGFDANMVIETIQELGLDESSKVDHTIDPQCGVCGSGKPNSETGEPTQTFYGQTLHPCCVQELAKVLDLFIPKED